MNHLKKAVKRIRNGGEKKTHTKNQSWDLEIHRLSGWGTLNYSVHTGCVDRVDGMSGEYAHFLME